MMLEDIIGSSPVRTATKYLESLREYSLRLFFYPSISPIKKQREGTHLPQSLNK